MFNIEMCFAIVAAICWLVKVDWTVFHHGVPETRECLKPWGHHHPGPRPPLTMKNRLQEPAGETPAGRTLNQPSG